MTQDPDGPFAETDSHYDDDEEAETEDDHSPRGSGGHSLGHLSIKQTTEYLGAIEGEVSKAILGKRGVIRMVLAGMLSNGNILFEDFPGLAKTLLSNSLADALGCEFKRVQFTPDLLPADITGSYFFDPAENRFSFRKGPIFCNILLADEINRAPPKTQAALLEAMQEKQVTIEGTTHELPKPFIVLATQNPIEYEGTYPLPEAQVDRFLIKLSMGYPDEDVETQILSNRQDRQKDDVDLRAITDPRVVQAMHQAVEEVYVDPRILRYIVKIVQATRVDPRVAVGSSPRGSQGLFKLARALAATAGRDYVVPDDVKQSILPVLGHRLILKPEARIRGIKPEAILNEVITSIAVPAAQINA